MDDEFRAEFLGEVVAEFDHFLELVGRVDVQQREGKFAGVESLLREADHDRGVLADGVEHHRFGKFGDDLPHNVYAFGFQRAKMAESTRIHVSFLR